MNLYQELKWQIGKRLNGVSYNIDLVNYCSLKCPSCAVGSIKIPRDGSVMSFDLFKRILDKGEKEGKVRKVQFYMFSDPALHKDLHLFVGECFDRGIRSNLSTMCQTYKCDWGKVIEARPTEMRISFPGWRWMTKFQKGARAEVFNKNVEMMMTLPRHKETVWTSAFHLYNCNSDEIPQAEAWASERNLKLVVLPAIHMSCEKVVEQTYTPDDEELISHLLEHPQESIARMKLSPDWCDNWRQVAIDAKGMTYLCQLVYEERFKLVPFMDYSLRELQKMQRSHSFCGKCMKAGGNVYQACFAEFDHKDPIKEADKRRRKNKDYTPLSNLEER